MSSQGKLPHIVVPLEDKDERINGRLQGGVTKTWPQVIAINVACLIALTSGLQSAWTSPSIVSLTTDKTTYDITLREASLLPLLPSVSMVIFCPLISKLYDSYGRKKILIMSAIPQLVSWILVLIAKDINTFYIARLLAGMGEACYFSAVPAYVAEISVPKVRGSWGNLVSLLRYVGSFLINVLGSAMSIRMTAAVCTVVPVVFLLVMPFMPESPYFLIMKGRDKEAKLALADLRSARLTTKYYSKKKPNRHQAGKTQKVKDQLEVIESKAPVEKEKGTNGTTNLDGESQKPSDITSHRDRLTVPEATHPLLTDPSESQVIILDALTTSKSDTKMTFSGSRSRYLNSSLASLSKEYRFPPFILAEYQKLRSDVLRQMEEQGTWRDLVVIRANRRGLYAALFLRVAQAFGGMITFNFYNQFIFRKALGDPTLSKTWSCIYSALLCACVALGSSLVDRLGRRRSFVLSTFISGALLLAESAHFYYATPIGLGTVGTSDIKGGVMGVNDTLTSQGSTHLDHTPLVSNLVAGGLLLYCFFCGVGVAIVPTLMLGELFSASVKAKALTVMAVTTAVVIFAANHTFYWLCERGGGLATPFLFFGACSVLAGAGAWAGAVPETSGKTLEEIRRELAGEKL